MAAPRRKSAQWWLGEIDAACKRDKDYLTEGRRVIDIYSGRKKDLIPFNILFSNTETYLPALYSAVPRPVVDRRYKDADPIGKAAAEAGERGLAFLLDTDLEGYETFDEAMNCAVLDALLPGRGVTAIEYDAKLKKVEGYGAAAAAAPEKEPSERSDATDDDEDQDGTDGEEDALEEKATELVCCDAIGWDRMVHGYAKKWSRVPWVAYKMEIDRGESRRLFGGAVTAKLNFAKASSEDKAGTRADANKGETPVTTVWQVWDKPRREVFYISEQMKDQVLAPAADPLELTGFFNCPKPIVFIAKSNDLAPTAPYLMYENQAEELNILTVRINRISTALKVRGAYDSSLGDSIKKILEADDNAFIPTDEKTAAFQDGAFEKMIWMMPLQELVGVLHELYNAREQCKSVIFEIMGLADIMRGASQASETLGAQQIKQSWSSLRLRRTQKEVQRYAVDILRMMLEIAAKKFSQDTWARMTGLPYLTDEAFAKAQRMFMAAQKNAQMAPQDPQSAQAVQQAQEALQAPRWKAVLDMLRDDLQRAYRIDIETNSTVQPEAVEDQKNIADVMNALGQFLNGIGPLVAKGVMPWQAAQAMCLAIVRRFRFGSEIEDYIMQMKAPAQADPNAAAQAELQAKQASEQAQLASDEKIAMAKLQSSQQEAQGRMQVEQQRIASQERIELERSKEETARQAMKLEDERRARQAEQQQEKALETMRMQAETDRAVKVEMIKADAQTRAALIAAGKVGETPEERAGRIAEENDRALLSTQLIHDLMRKSAAQDGTVGALAQQLQALAADASAPPEIVGRDANGFATHWKKGTRSGTVARDENGRASALVPTPPQVQ